MGPVPARLRTPPPTEKFPCGLLTPPLTAKANTNVRFAHDDGSPIKPKRRSQKQDRQEEAAIAEYTELYVSNEDSQGSSIDIESVTTSAPASPTSPTPTGYSISSPSSTSGTPISNEDNGVADPIDDNKHLGSVTATDITCNLTSIDPIQPFRFLALPVAVRKRIYTHLLVIPALICVRQNHTSYHNQERAFLYTEERSLLPGISYALPQRIVSGFKTRFHRFPHTNVAILRVCKEVHAEAKAVMYGANAFEIVCPNMELSPTPDYGIRLFPKGCQRLVASLTIRVGALYPLKWLLNGGFAELKNAYRGLESLEIVFEMEEAGIGAGKKMNKGEGEEWRGYVKRIHRIMANDLFAGNKEAKHIPAWIKLRVLFNGEAYTDTTEPGTHNIRINVETVGPPMDITELAKERLRRFHLKRSLSEAFEMFKK